MKQVESLNEWYAMLDEIEQQQTPTHIEAMARLHDLEVQSEGRIQVTQINTINPHGN